MEYPQVIIQKFCPLCKSADVKPVKTEQHDFSNAVHPEVTVFDKTWGQLIECCNCGFAYSKEIPSHKDFFKKRYDIQFDPELESKNPFKDVINNDVIISVKKIAPKNCKFLDIGSFGGILLRIAQKEGYQVYGVETNPTMANYTKDNLGLDVFCGEISEFQGKSGPYKIITLIDVLEHLFEPRKILEKCVELLDNDGIIYIKVPNYKMQKIKQNIANLLGISKLGIFAGFGHINQFSPKALDKLGDNVGLQSIGSYVARSEAFVGRNNKEKIKNIFRSIVYFALEGLRKVTGINLGLNIIHIYKKVK